MLNDNCSLYIKNGNWKVTEEWENIKPQFCCKKLHPEWTNILYEMIEAFNHYALKIFPTTELI